MASTGERVASLGFALLVCLSLIGGGVAPSPVGTATAQAGDGSGGPCQAEDWFLTLITGTIFTTNCQTAEDISDTWNETDATETRTQIHSQSGQLAAGNEQYLTAMSNSLVESDTIAFSKAEAAAVEVLANGGTVSEAKQAANQSVEDYYTTKQLNIEDRREVAIETVVTLNERAENTTGVSADFVTMAPDDGQYGDGPWPNDPTDGHNELEETAINKTGTQTVSLVNGTQVQVSTIIVDVTDSQSTFQREVQFGDYRISGQFAGRITLDSVKVRPTDNLTGKTVTDLREIHQSWTDVENKSQSTKKEVAAYVEQSLGPAVDSGELNATNYISPSTLAQEYATEYKNTTSYVDATAFAAYSGMSTPDLNNTGSMTVTHNGTTYEGLLLSQNAPDGGWQSGETYDPALLSGMQLFAVAGDNGRIIELDGPFTIDAISGPSGDPINTADTVEVTYETANTSDDYAALQEQIRTLNEEIEERKAQATSGGSDTTTNTNLLDQLAAALGVSVGAAVVVVGGAVVIAARFYLQ